VPLCLVIKDLASGIGLGSASFFESWAFVD